MLPARPEPATEPGRGWRLLLLAVLLTVGASVPVSAPAAQAEHPGPPPTAASDPPRVPALWMPVAGAVVRGFDARAGPYGPGHRGIDIAAPVGEGVRAPAAGRVVFAGPVAGTNWVSILAAPGVTVTLGPLLDRVVTAGRVRPRTPVGRVAPGHPGGRAGRDGPGHPVGRAGRDGSAHEAGPVGRGGSGTVATLHLSVRVDGVHVDPLAYLVDRPRPRLAPLLAPGGLAGH